MKHDYLCLLCEEVQPEGGEFQHDCPLQAIVKRRVPTRWERFCRWLLRIDVTFFLATAGGVAVNVVITRHLHFTPLESIIEGLGFGFLLGRLVRYGDL